MAILGTLVDKISAQSFAAAAGSAPVTSFATHAHGLGATVPETILPVLTSIGGANHIAPPALLAIGANESVATVGINYASGATLPLAAYDLTQIVWHTAIR